MAYTLYKEIKYALAGIPGENLSGFPKRFLITADADIAAELASGGGVKVTSADGLTDLPFGLYPDTNLAAGTVHFRVKADLLTAANVGDVICRLYYDAAETTVEDKAGTVDNGYSHFMPLEEDPSGSAPQMFDWVSESNIGTSGGSMASGDEVAAQVANGIEFDGTQRIEMAQWTGSDNASFTVEIIAKTSDWNTAVRPLVSHHVGGGDAGWRIGHRLNKPDALLDDGPDIVTFQSTDWGSATFTANQAAHVSLVVDRTAAEATVRVDGVNAVTKSISAIGSMNRVNTELTLAAITNGTSAGFVGVLDEFRASTVARSANWLAFAYTDDFDNADTFTLGAEQGAGGAAEITPNAATHAHSATSPAITQEHVLTPDSAAHGHAATSPSLTQTHAIGPDSGQHEHAATSPTVSQEHAIEPADASHAHTASSPTVSTETIVEPASGLHGHQATSPALSQVHLVTPDSATHAHAATSPVLTQLHVVQPSDCVHGHLAGEPIILLGVATGLGLRIVAIGWFRPGAQAAGGLKDRGNFP